MGTKGNEYVYIMDRLESFGFDLGEVNALDAFAREGMFRTVDYADKVKSLTAWEIKEDLARSFEKNFPFASVVCCDSHIAMKHAASISDKGIWDMIVLDTPCRIFGEYCEHFNIIEDSLKCLKKDRPVILILNVFNFIYTRHLDTYKEHLRRRENFYGKKDPISYTDLHNFYVVYFRNRGFKTKNLITKNHSHIMGYEFWAFILEYKNVTN